MTTTMAEKKRTSEDENPFRPKTEEELMERIDQSIAQADDGRLLDAKEVADELIAEFAVSSTSSGKCHSMKTR